MQGRIALAHVNVATKGSTWRKLAVVALVHALRLPLTLHLHAGEYPTFYRDLPRTGQRVVRWMFQAADCVIVLGESWRGFAEATLGVDPRRVEVLHNGIPDPLKSGVREVTRSVELEAGPLRLLFVGKLDARKGVGDLLQALADSGIAGGNWQLDVVGQGDSRPWHDLARKLDIAGQVNFAGWLGHVELTELYRSADVFVLPSYAEGLSIALLEAMAFRLAIVTTAVGAHEEVIENGVNGLVVCAGDVPALSAALGRLLGNRTDREDFGRRARASFVERFELNEWTDRLLEIYQPMLDRTMAR